MTHQSDTDTPLLAIDWGTTHRRLFLIDRDGRCLMDATDDRGVAALGKPGLDAEMAALGQRFAGHRFLLAGMIGSSIGWREVPYIACPASLGALMAALPANDAGAVAIIPGVRAAPEDPADVMRGEEVQLLGAVEAGLVPPDCTICHPGTHAKWARISGYAIQRFRTVMTGELFAILRAGSILAPALSGPVAADGAFLSGVMQGLLGDALAADLFSIRARLLLGQMTPEEAPAWASGILIGHDVRFGLRAFADHAPIALIGDPQLTALYAAALDAAGQSCFEVDGKAAFIAGAHALSGRMPCPM